MDVQTNLSTNPGFTAELAPSSAGTNASLVWVASGGRTNQGCARLTSLAAGLFRMNVQSIDNVTPGKTYTISAYVRPSVAGRVVRLQVDFNNGNTFVQSALGPASTLPSFPMSRLSMTTTVPAGITRMPIFVRVENGSAAGETLVVDDILIEESGTLNEYYDGGFARDGDWLYAWTGAPDKSASTRTLFEVDAWTRRWWDILPTQYKRMDVLQNPDMGGSPMLRFMDGIGRMGGEMRQVSDDLWFGRYTDPVRAPDSTIPWLAQLLGVPPSQRNVPTLELRNRLIDITSSGRKAIGTRGAIAEAVKRFLNGARQVQVGPSRTAPHTIVVLVRADEVPNSDLAALGTKIRAANVLPAGHVLVVQSAAPTWDSWEAGLTTWTSKETQVRTWVESDSRGVVLE